MPRQEGAHSHAYTVAYSSCLGGQRSPSTTSDAYAATCATYAYAGAHAAASHAHTG